MVSSFVLVPMNTGQRLIRRHLNAEIIHIAIEDKNYAQRLNNPPCLDFRLTTVRLQYIY
jgi:hypothetical protein